MPTSFSYEWKTSAYTGKTSFPTGLFIGGEWVDANGKLLTKISEATEKDVDRAVEAAQKAMDTTWGLHCPGARRAELLGNLGRLMDKYHDELSALEALDNGKTFAWADKADVTSSTEVIKYYAGWADKITGQTLETTEKKMIYTRHEPLELLLLMLTWKVGPALATGNAIVLKPSEFTPLTAIRMCGLIQEAGFPPGVVNIEKVAFTGSTLVGRKIMEAAAKSNLKDVTLELGGKSPNIIYDDADMEQAVNWAAFGIFWNHGQACCAGSRIFVQEGIYDEFLKRFTEKSRAIRVGDPFETGIDQGPQVSQQQYDRIMEYIDSGKKEGATVHLGGDRHGTEGYFINPTIFTETKPDMKIVKEEIFGPVGVVIKFKDEDDVIRQANETVYGLASAVFTQNINRALDTAHRLHAGTAWINCVNQLHGNVPFGGCKQSGIGRELGEYALAHYSHIKAVHINLGHQM
ncbi:NAD-dependent aldehyde dehydrogenase [Infundibulicybe gibba]|nr:NAD-dependent aldehyde dehydrogenase [Infundibulicybe gibba]